MAVEIERKFLVKSEAYRQLARPVFFRQGYLSRAKERVVRIRVEGEKAFLTVKGTTRGFARTEYEDEIPLGDAEHMLAELCEKPIMEKDRYRIVHNGVEWDVDEFHGANEGLVIAEVSLNDENQDVALPDWAGREVSNEPRYFNVNLAKQPYSNW
ncbi:MAG: CYTH domain-containing protein [Phycisphaerae bacterium]|jgi:CYTH domain-containing protein